MEKRCSKCREIKDVKEFSKRSASKDGFCCNCKECVLVTVEKRVLKYRSKINYKSVGKKRCGKCKKIRNVSEFNKNRRNKDGLHSRCKQCRRENRVINKEKIAKYKKKYRELNKELISTKVKQHYKLNKEKITKYRKKYQKKYYEDNKAKCNLYHKLYYQNNSDTIKKTVKQYSLKNKEKLTLQQKEYRNSNAKYKSFYKRLTVDEAPRLHEDSKSLEVLCKYCRKYFIPKNDAVDRRVSALNGRAAGDGHLYCSEECKNNCPTYGQHEFPKGFKKGTSREVSTYLRQLCFERDDWTCQKCGATENLHCHHIKGYAQNKILANDIDNVITLCKSCHKEVHSEVGCRYVDLRC